MTLDYEIKTHDGKSYSLQFGGREVMVADGHQFAVNILGFAGWLLGEAAEILKKDQEERK